MKKLLSLSLIITFLNIPAFNLPGVNPEQITAIKAALTEMSNHTQKKLVETLMSLLLLDSHPKQRSSAVYYCSPTTVPRKHF